VFHAVRDTVKLAFALALYSGYLAAKLCVE